MANAPLHIRGGVYPSEHNAHTRAGVAPGGRTVYQGDEAHGRELLHLLDELPAAAIDELLAACGPDVFKGSHYIPPAE